MRVLAVCFLVLWSNLTGECYSQITGSIRSDTLADFHLSHLALIDVDLRLERVNTWLKSIEKNDGFASGMITSSTCAGVMAFHFKEMSKLFGEDLNLTYIPHEPNTLVYSCRSDRLVSADNFLRSWMMGFRSGLAQRGTLSEPATTLEGPYFGLSSGSTKLSKLALPVNRAYANLVAQNAKELENIFGSYLKVKDEQAENRLNFICSESKVENATDFLQSWISGFDCGYFHTEKAEQFIKAHLTPDTPSPVIDVPLQDLNRPIRQKMLDTLYPHHFDGLYSSESVRILKRPMQK